MSPRHPRACSNSGKTAYLAWRSAGTARAQRQAMNSRASTLVMVAVLFAPGAAHGLPRGTPMDVELVEHPMVRRIVIEGLTEVRPDGLLETILERAPEA